MKNERSAEQRQNDRLAVLNLLKKHKEEMLTTGEIAAELQIARDSPAPYFHLTYDIHHLVKEGTVNSFKEAGERMKYRLRQPKEHKHQAKRYTNSRRKNQLKANGVAPTATVVASVDRTSPAAYSHVAADLPPTRFIVIPPLEQMDNPRLLGICKEIRVEVSGQTLFLEFGKAKLVVAV